jgi:protein gp37
MSDNSAIEWCDATWNPTTGCTRITTGCDRCYAARFAERFRGVPGHPYESGFDLTLRPERLKQPLEWKRSRMIFVDSMSDLFHKDIPTTYIDQVFDTMEAADWHHFQVITKRSSLMRDYVRERYATRPPPPHVWLGVSIEDAVSKIRIEHLRATPAAVRFLSIEPLLGPLGPLDLSGIHWVLLGGETGPGARPMQIEWVREIRDRCVEQSTAFYFKRWGGPRPKSSGRTLDGRTWQQFPADGAIDDSSPTVATTERSDDASGSPFSCPRDGSLQRTYLRKR